MTWRRKWRLHTKVLISYNIVNAILVTIILFFLCWHERNSWKNELRTQEGMLRSQIVSLHQQATVAVEWLANREDILTPGSRTAKSECNLLYDLLHQIGVDKLSIIRFSPDYSRAELEIIFPPNVTYNQSNIVDQACVQELLRTGKTVSSSLFKPVEEDIPTKRAVVVMAPVKAKDGSVKGAVSAIIDVTKFAGYLNPNKEWFQLLIDQEVPQDDRGATRKPPVVLGEPFPIHDHQWQVSMVQGWSPPQWFWWLLICWLIFAHGLGTLTVFRMINTVSRYYPIAEAINAPIVFSGPPPESRIFYANEAICTLLGYTRSELMRMRREDLIHPEDRAIVAKRLTRPQKGHDGRLSDPVEIRNLTKDGEAIWVQWTTVYLIPLFGKRSEILSFGIDMREQRAKETRYQSLVESLAAFVVEVDLRGVVRYVNPFACKVLMRSRDGILGMPFENLLYDPQSQPLSELLADALRTERVDPARSERLCLTGPEGKELWVDWTFRRLDAEPGAGERTVLVLGNFLTKVGSWNTLTDSIQGAVFLISSDRTVRYANKYALEVFEKVGSPLVGNTFDHFVHPDDQIRIIDFFTSLPKDRPELTVNRNIAADGKEIWMRWTNCLIKPIWDPNAPSEYLSVGIDITNEHNKREALQQLNARYTEIVRSISHDMDAPFDAIVKAANTIQEGIPPPLHEHIRRIVNCNQFLLALMRDLIVFTGNDSTQQHSQLTIREFDGRDWANSAAEFLYYKRDKPEYRQIEFRVETDEHLKITADYERSRQILFNLLKNALKACKNIYATIIIRLTSTANSVRVAVVDPGEGIDATKDKELHTALQQPLGLDPSAGRQGMGLRIVKMLVEQHHGELGWSSKGKGCGSEFWFTLPHPISSTNLLSRVSSGSSLSFVIIPPSGATQHLVYILGDGDGLRPGVSNGLIKSGYRVRHFSDVPAMTHALEESKPESLLIFQTEKDDPRDWLIELNRLDCWKAIPRLLLRGLARPADEYRDMTSIQVPVPTNVLIQALHSVTLH